MGKPALPLKGPKRQLPKILKGLIESYQPPQHFPAK